VSIDDADKRAVDWQRDFTEALMANTRIGRPHHIDMLRFERDEYPGSFL
jgi:hypothetical protein